MAGTRKIRLKRPPHIVRRDYYYARDVAGIIGVTPQTIRYWERAGFWKFQYDHHQRRLVHKRDVWKLWFVCYGRRGRTFMKSHGPNGR